MTVKKVLEYIITAKDQTTNALKSAAGRIKGFVSGVFGNLMNIKAGWDMLSGTVNAAVGSISNAAKRLWSAITEAMRFETVEKQFAILMGSMEKAKAHMKDLADFSAKTPFEFNEIAKASRLLVTFSGGALGARDSLTLLGDVAYATGNKFDEVAFWVGRLYAALKGGQPYGEAAMRLTEMAILTPEVRTKMEDLTKTAGNSAAAWAVLETHMKKYDGAMNDSKSSGDALVSTVKDNWTAIVRDFGMAFLDLAKTEMGYLISVMDRIRADGTIKKWAEEALAAIKPLVEAVGNLFDGESRKLTLYIAWDSLLATFHAGAAMVSEGIAFAFEKVAAKIPSLAEALGKGLISILKSPWYIGKAIGRELGTGTINVAAAAEKQWGFDDEANIEARRKRAVEEWRDQYNGESSEGSLGERIDPIYEKLKRTLKENAAIVEQAAEERRARQAAYDKEQEKKAAEAPQAPSTQAQEQLTAAEDLRQADERERAKEREAETKSALDAQLADVERNIERDTKNLEAARNEAEKAKEAANAKPTMDDVDRRMSETEKAKEDARMQKKYERNLERVQRQIDNGVDPSKLSRKDRAIWELDQERKKAKADLDAAKLKQQQALDSIQANSKTQAATMLEIKQNLEKVLAVGA